jgi:hypothetical protein
MIVLKTVHADWIQYDFLVATVFNCLLKLHRSVGGECGCSHLSELLMASRVCITSKGILKRGFSGTLCLYYIAKSLFDFLSFESRNTKNTVFSLIEAPALTLFGARLVTVNTPPPLSTVTAVTVLKKWRTENLGSMVSIFCHILANVGS